MFPGWVTGAQIRALSSISDAGLLPYPSDLDFKRSMPNKSIEYLAHGLPILTSLAGPISNLVKSEKCGKLYEETDYTSLARLIASLIEGNNELATMSANASRVFAERFSASKVYGALVSKIESLAKRKSGPLIGANFGAP
jgi:glycosyltransferase involved in cell wall biosynthesis